jgi:hypothetical protein
MAVPSTINPPWSAPITGDDRGPLREGRARLDLLAGGDRPRLLHQRRICLWRFTSLAPPGGARLVHRGA